MSGEDTAYTDTLERLQAAIAAEQQRRGELDPAPLTEEELTAQQGTRRSRASMERDDEFPPNPTLQPANPFTLEDARAYKRTKKLSAESEVDAEAFLQVNGSLLCPIDASDTCKLDGQRREPLVPELRRDSHLPRPAHPHHC